MVTITEEIAAGNFLACLQFVNEELMQCNKSLFTALFCMLLLVTVTSCSSKPVVVATWTFVNATKTGCFV